MAPKAAPRPYPEEGPEVSGPLAQSQRMGQMGRSSLCRLFLGSSMPPHPPDTTALPFPISGPGSHDTTRGAWDMGGGPSQHGQPAATL